MIKRVLITGANAGIGKETAKQLAQQSGIEKIYLGCRQLDKAQAAKAELESFSKQGLFEILLLDVSDVNSVHRAVDALPEPVDALIMNAGGTGGKHFNQLNKDGVTQIFAVNLLGHAVLTDALLKAEKLTQVALYAGSEAARGVKEMGMKRPTLTSVEEFTAMADGSLYANTHDATVSYGAIKYMAALWMSAMARHHPSIKFITMSPGATVGTEGFNTLPVLKQFIMKGMMKVMLWFGKVHRVEEAARRYLDGLRNDAFHSGGFFASEKGMSGPVSDQSALFDHFSNKAFQDNAYAAMKSLTA